MLIRGFLVISLQVMLKLLSMEMVDSLSLDFILFIGLIELLHSSFTGFRCLSLKFIGAFSYLILLAILFTGLVSGTRLTMKGPRPIKQNKICL